MNTSINFPNLGIHLSNVGKSISIGGFEIAYYGMIIACGMILGLCIAMWVAKKTNQNPDQYFDVALYAIPIALIGGESVLCYLFLGSVQRQSDPHSVFPGRRTGDIRRCDCGSDYILCICKNKKTKFLADGRHRMCRAGFGTDHRSLG